ncbi:MAG: sulfite exporter TauE/SafE family protein, partial [Pseudomonadota bacterium]
MSVVLVCLFLLTATLYASVGFGGGSTYAAILSLAGIDYRLVPITALIFNITVVLGAAIRHHLANLTPIRRMLPFLIASVPAAYVGGRLPISEIVFTGVLGAALIVSGLNLLARNNEGDGAKTMRPRLAHLSLLIGSGIGFIAGLTGIGGGIFLAP